MKVLYVFLDSTKSPGVIKKVKSKIKLLNGDGVSMEGLFININIIEYSFNEEENITYVPLIVPKLSLFYNRRYIRNFKVKFEYNNYYKHLYDTLDLEISKRKFDVILFRYPLANKYLYKFIKKHRNKIVFEHNSKELVELGLNGGSTTNTYIQEEKYGHRILRLAKGITGVGKEITTYEVNRSTKSGLPNRVISNSIEVSSLKQRIVPELDKVNYNFLYLTGSPSPWVGIDIVIRSFAEFKQEGKNCTLYIVGPKADSLIALANELNLNEHVLFVGEKTGSELDEYFSKCHVAFGTMAMQRVGLQEHSSLKILEYASRGIPFVVGYDDTNFVNNNEFSPFVLKLQFNNKTFDFNKVILFTNSVYEIKDHPFIMRDLAFKYLDTSLKMNQLREFLVSLK